MQGIIGPKGEFLSISMNVCSSTHDSTAYEVSGVHQIIKEGLLPSWAHIVFDEAYPNRPQEISPYRGKNLDVYKDAFNYLLSLNRQVVERGFGMLVGRWGVLWRPLRIKFSRIPLLLRVCCKLHNICMSRFYANDTVHMAKGDYQVGDCATPVYTNNTGMHRGRRTDLEETNYRTDILNIITQKQYERPPHSRSRKFIVRMK